MAVGRILHTAKMHSFLQNCYKSSSKNKSIGDTRINYTNKYHVAEEKGKSNKILKFKAPFNIFIKFKAFSSFPWLSDTHIDSCQNSN